jgi:hypothetical protein
VTDLYRSTHLTSSLTIPGARQPPIDQKAYQSTSTQSLISYRST